MSPYGVPGSARPKAKRFGKGRGAKPKGGGSGNQVVAGPWGGPPTGGPTPLEQAELDVLSAGRVPFLGRWPGRCCSSVRPRWCRG